MIFFNNKTYNSEKMFVENVIIIITTTIYGEVYWTMSNQWVRMISIWSHPNNNREIYNKEVENGNKDTRKNNKLIKMKQVNPNNKI